MLLPLPIGCPVFGLGGLYGQPKAEQVMTPSGFSLPSSGTQIGLGLLGPYPYQAYNLRLLMPNCC